MIKILKNKKGLTLVELIIGMVVLSIILIMASAVLLPTLQFQRRANELAEQNALLDNLANQIVYDLSRAVEPVLFSGGVLKIPVGAAGGGEVIYTVNSIGLIERQTAGEAIAQPLLPNRFHRGLMVDNISLVQVDDTDLDIPGIVYELTVSLVNDNTTFTRDYIVRPLGLNQSN